ncbi:MAG: Hpt domain-containing protein [Proteobacteria bacterium]|nr:Hpt domain-containing protein [Pseudomonadota bacterium]
MSEGVVRHIPVVNRLAKLIHIPGGKRLSEAIADAQANLGAIKPDCIEAIDEALAEVVLLTKQPGGPDASTLARLYDLANHINGTAGHFGLEDMGKAAYSLCDLIDAAQDSGGAERTAVMVHVESLALLRHPEGLGEVGRKAVLDGLAKVVSHARGKRA